MAFDSGQVVRIGGQPPRAPARDASFAIGRRSDLDWLRVGAFGLLILFHVGLVYAPFDWHIHSRHTEGWLREGILLTGPWRLTLLFLISGCALKLMSRKLDAGAVLKARFARLVPPALFGILILVPPQAWIEALDKRWYTGDLFGWYAHQFSAEGLAGGLPVNHMWFVLYILVYSMAATLLIALPKVQAALSRALAWALRGPALLLLPIAYLTLARHELFLRYGISNHLSSDWYNHAVSLGAFLLGFLMVGEDGFWRTAIRWRWAAAVLAAMALPTLMFIESMPEVIPEPWWTSAAFSIDQWAMIAAILGFGAKHLRDRDGPVLRYLTQAVFPCYLVHQTILVAGVWMIRPLNLPAPAEALMLVSITVGGCFAIYELVRRVNLIRPLFGLKPMPRRVLDPPILKPTPTRTPTPALTAEAA
jgi:peptidoglycan/LPS O-acetylase OafA/YrhL